jgi:putative ABC transport system ATP-binding protein
MKKKKKAAEKRNTKKGSKKPEKKPKDGRKKHEEFVIRLKGVTKHYHMGRHIIRAVDGVDIKIKLGDFVAIMGPSGSGKSTSMNLVGSLDLATSGSIFLDGVDIETLTESELAQIRGRRIGFIFQRFNLIPNLTALENITLPMVFQQKDSFERVETAKKLLKKVGLEERANHYPGQLSGGESQRIAIARALANDPDVILADEPTGNLDTKTGEIILEFLDSLNKEGKTIIMVTHDADLAKKYANTIFWLKDGKIQNVTKQNKKIR